MGLKFILALERYILIPADNTFNAGPICFNKNMVQFILLRQIKGSWHRRNRLTLLGMCHTPLVDAECFLCLSIDVSFSLATRFIPVPTGVTVFWIHPVSWSVARVDISTIRFTDSNNKALRITSHPCEYFYPGKMKTFTGTVSMDLFQYRYIHLKIGSFSYSTTLYMVVNVMQV